MITVIGTNGCIRCMQAKMKLDNNHISYTYKLITDLPTEEQDALIEKATKCGMMNFPLILQNDKLIKLEEIVND